MKTEPDQIQRRKGSEGQIQAQVRRYIDRHGWDVAEDEEYWRQYQRVRMAEEYRGDEW